MRKMRVGIVGGQKRKTEAHLFKCLEKMDIEVAWHVEAMTTQAFSDDCDAIVSMVDYVGYGLFAQAKQFAAKKNIPFRQISFNWAKTKPTFVELQTKYNNLHTEIANINNGDSNMKKIPRENEHMFTRCECLKELKFGFRIFQKLESEGKFLSYQAIQLNKAIKLYDVREVRAALNEHKRSALMNEGEKPPALMNEDEIINLKRTTRAFFEHGANNAGKIIEKTITELLASDNKETNDRHSKILNDSQIQEKQNYERMMLCRVYGETLIPLTDVSSMEEARDLSTIELNPDENEFVVIQIVGSFKTKTVVVFEDTKWGK